MAFPSVVATIGCSCLTRLVTYAIIQNSIMCAHNILVLIIINIIAMQFQFYFGVGMKLSFKNKSRYAAVISIAGVDYIVSPRESKIIEHSVGCELEISVSLRGKTEFKGDLLYISLVSTYRYTQIGEYCEFTITREKIRFSPNAIYERMFLDADHASFESVSYAAKGVKSIDDLYRRYNTVKTLLFAPFDDLIGGTASLFFLGLCLSFAFGWRFALIYFPIAYLVTVAISFFTQNLVNSSVKRKFGFDEVRDFQEYLDPAYISAYYMMPNRKPFLGKIDRD